MLPVFQSLIECGFLSKAKRQLVTAQNSLQNEINNNYELGEKELYDTFYSFDDKHRKKQFNSCFEGLNIYHVIAENRDAAIQDPEDVILLSTELFTIYAALTKKVVMTAAKEDQRDFNVQPYYFTKRKIEGQIFWFCMAWNRSPFPPPTHN